MFYKGFMGLEASKFLYLLGDKNLAFKKAGKQHKCWIPTPNCTIELHGFR